MMAWFGEGSDRNLKIIVYKKNINEGEGASKKKIEEPVTRR